MKKYLIFTFGAFLVIGGFAFAHSVFAANYSYYRAITVTSTTSIASGTNANFPMLFSGTYPWLEASSTSGGAGRIQNLTTAPNGGQEPADLIFVTSTPTQSGGAWSCGASLNFETESYTSSTGALVDWVNVPTMQAGSVIYACYGSSAITTDQSHPSSTWNSNYLGVYHFGTPTTLSGNDSTANGNNGTLVNSPAAAAGEIGAAAVFSAASDQYISNSTMSLPVGSDITISMWAYVLSVGSSPSAFSIGGSQSPNRVQAHIPWNDDTLYWDYGTCCSTGRVTTPYSSDLGSWTYVTLVGKGNNTFQAIYIDGVLVSSQNSGQAPTTSQTGITIGAWPASGYPFNGDLDEFRVSKAVLSSSWILTEYDNQSSPSTFYTVGSEQTGTAPTISSFSASPSTVAANGTSTLSWSTTNAASLSISPTIGTVTGTSTTTPSLSATTVYTLTATNANGSATATTTVTVQATSSSSTNISSATGAHWAWNDEIGWIDFNAGGTGNVQVLPNKLEGYASSSVGPISLNCDATNPSGVSICGSSTYAVANDGAGDLSGWAWNDEIGWISFFWGNTSSNPSASTTALCATYLSLNYSPAPTCGVNIVSGNFYGWAWNDSVGWIDFNCGNPADPICGNSFDVVTTWIPQAATGTVDSQIFDTGVASGAQLNSVIWKGVASSSTSVAFQFAVSNSTGGPWNYQGPNGTSSTYYGGAGYGPGTPIPLNNYSLTGRYFRYRVTLTTNSSQTLTPRVDDIIVNWSP